MKKSLVLLCLLAAFFSCFDAEKADESSADIKNYAVTWNLNYAGAPVPETEQVKEGSLLTVPESPERDGLYPVDWYRESSCETRWNFETDTVTSDIILYAKWNYKPYLTFKGSSSFSIKVSRPGWNGTVEYSTDAVKWKRFTGSAVTAQKSSGSYYLYFRGKKNTRITGEYCCRWTIKGTAGCYGNIMTLLNYSDPEKASMAPYCFYYMFGYCAGLTEAPALPALKLSDYCYFGMFFNCGLTAAPALPAVRLTDSCYGAMFSGCKKLTEAPALPAVKLAGSCYQDMFHGCRMLAVPPALPAAKLASCCYYEMFSGCSSLKISKTGKGTLFLSLPAGMPSGAVRYMFSGTGGTFKGTPVRNGKYRYE